MTSDDPDESPTGDDDATGDDATGTEGERVPITVDDERGREFVEDGSTGSTTDEVDQRIVDLLSWILDTETRAKIYVFLLANPGSTSEEVAKGTGLYPSTVREALADLHDEERVSREKRASEGAGNNPYEYTAIQPSELVGSVVDQVQQELNTIVNLDRILDRGTVGEDVDEDADPVTITVDDVDADVTDATGDDVDHDVADDTAFDDGARDDDETLETDDSGADDEGPGTDEFDGEGGPGA